MALAFELEEISSLSSSKLNWKIKNFSNFKQVYGYSTVFSVGSFKWKSSVYPKGRGKVYDHLSLFLLPVDLTKSVNTEYSFAITSQTDPKNRVRLEGKHTFQEGHGGWGFAKFMPLSELLHDPNKGYIVDDTCIITVEVTCWMKEEEHSILKESKPDKIPAEAKRAKIIGDLIS